MYSRGLGSVV